MILSNQASTSGRHRYLVRTSDGHDLHDHETAGFEQAMVHLRHVLGVRETESINPARFAWRWRLEHGSVSIRLFGCLGQGQWLCLDPEDVHDVLLDPSLRSEYERGIVALPGSLPSITYRLRMTHPDGVEAITEHTDIRSVFQAISDAWDYHPPLRPGFAKGLWRSGPEPDDFALSARLGRGSGAIPLALSRAEQALVSNHAELDLVRALHHEIILVK